MTKGEKIFNAVAEARAKNPNVTIAEVADKLGISSQLYYGYAKKGGGKKAPATKAAAKTRQRTPAKVVVGAKTSHGMQVMIASGSPEQLRAFVGTLI